MQLRKLLIPAHIQGVSVDLWGTLFFDSCYSDKLFEARCKLLKKTEATCLLSLNDSPSQKLTAEKERFLEYETYGDFLPIYERVSYLTEYKLSKRKTFEFISKLAEISSQFKPKINNDLVEMLIQLKPKYKLALVSNTGLISVHQTKQMLKTAGLIGLFDALIFSGDLMLCKPRPEIYFEASKQLNISIFNLLHIGDSFMNDYVAAQNAGCHSVLLSELKYEYG